MANAGTVGVGIICVIKTENRKQKKTDREELERRVGFSGRRCEGGHVGVAGAKKMSRLQRVERAPLYNNSKDLSIRR